MLIHLYTTDRRAVWCGAEPDGSLFRRSARLAEASCTSCLAGYRRDFADRAQAARVRSAEEAEATADAAEATATRTRTRSDRTEAKRARERARKLRAVAGSR